MPVEMSPEAVTNRMKALDRLWELAIALKSSEILDEADTSSLTDSPPPPFKPSDGEV